MRFSVSISRRNLVQHGLLIIALGCLLFVISDAPGVVISWVKYHKWFLLGWLGGCIILGYYSVSIARGRYVIRFLLWALARTRIARISLYRKTVVKSAANPLKMLMIMGSCSRCVSWWSALLFSFGYHLFYWQAWYAALYFALLGPAISSFTSIFIYLLRNENPYQEIQPEQR